ncbi:MAG: hypothetical protein MJ071_01460 [Oscillospiraceae bacterium]|nr:hypothetical protein [Oscillospiraceae bacterium]
MKNTSRIIVVIAAACEMGLGLLLYHFLSRSISATGALGILAGWLLLSVIADGLILHGSSASVVSDAKKLQTTDDYIKAFNAWLQEDTPFEDYIKIALKHLDSLKRKQKALRSILDDSKDSPFLNTANEVDAYILANCKRILNRVMIFDSNEPHKYNMHVAYLQEILGENARVLSEFENLILEVSQIGDDATAVTPCLNELTNALRSVRKSNAEFMSEHPEEQEQMRMQ